MENKEKESEKEVLSAETSPFEFLYKKENIIKCSAMWEMYSRMPSCQSIRRLSALVKLFDARKSAQQSELAKDPLIWLCGQCYTCNSRCPRNNTPATIILNARNKAFKEGYAPR